MERGDEALMAIPLTSLSRLRYAGFVVAAALWLTGPALAQEAIRDGGVLTGKLRLVHARHPNGTRIEAYQIVSVARAMPADDGFCTTDKGATTFHLFAITDAARRQLKPLLGKTVTLKTDELFCSQTAWHIGDVAVSRWTLLPPR
jgi:hypothetical protein